METESFGSDAEARISAGLRLQPPCGGLLSFVLEGGYEAGVRFLERAQIVQNAGSLGGVDTLGIQPAAMWGGRLDEATIREQGIEPGMIRIATGIEDPADLLADFEQALNR